MGSPPAEPFWAGAFLYDPAKRTILLHKRDGNTKFSPHKWAFFGGRNDPGATDVECCVRELAEEVGLQEQPSELKRVRKYVNKAVNQYRAVVLHQARVEPRQNSPGGTS